MANVWRKRGVRGARCDSRSGRRVSGALFVLVAGVVAACAPDDGIPRNPSGRPDFNGIWAALGNAYWDIEPHMARPALAMQEGPVVPVPANEIVALGAVGSVPSGQGIVVGGRIPYLPEALARREENREQWLERDPEIRCYLPGVPRANYMHLPFQIFHSDSKFFIAYEYAGAVRDIYLEDPGPPQVDSWMGHSLGSWDGDTLVIDVTAQVPDTWLDSAGNHHSNSIHVVERYTAISESHLMYEATIEDPEVYTRPWTIRLPLYRRIDENMQLLEYKCVEFAEERMYGHLRKDPDLTPVFRASGFGSAFDGEAPGPR